MAVLDTFYILFKSDATDVKKGSQEAEKATKNLNESLKATEVVTGHVGESFVHLANQFSGMILAALSLGTIISGVKSAVEYSNQLARTSQELKVSATNLDLWGNALKSTGGSAEEFAGTVKNLNAGVEEIAKKGNAAALAPIFKNLGISIKDNEGKIRDVITLLPEIAGSFEHLSKAKSEDLGKKLGLDHHTIMLLQQGQKEIDAVIKRQKELGTVTEKDVQVAKKYKDQWDDTSHAFRSLFTVVGTAVLPAFTMIVEGLEKVAVFFRKNQDFIVGILITLGAAISIYVIPPLVSMATAAVIAFGPFLILGAIIAGVSLAVGLLYDDIRGFMKGSDSVTGRVLQRWPVVGEVFKQVSENFKTMYEIVKQLWKQLMMLVTDPIQFIKKLGDEFLNLGKIIANVLGTFLGFKGGASIDATLKSTQQNIAAASNSPISSLTTNSVLSSSRESTRNTSVQTGPITIQTQATDATGIATDFDSSMKAQIRSAVGGMDDGLYA